MLTKKNLENLAGLARIELKKGEEEKLLKDLSKILDYFNELKKVDASGVEPMAGGTFLKNEFRKEDAPRLPSDLAVDQFPEKKEKFLKVPPVFE